jgi:hypothetical protein
MSSADTQPLTIATTLLATALEDLETYGNQGCESIAFFLARHDAPQAASTLVTADEPGVERSPFFVKLSERWILSLTDLCDERDEFVVGQIHAHGISAFHSETDDHHLFHAPGVFSLVVPNFARTERDKSRLAWAGFVGMPGGLFSEIDLSTAIDISEGSGDHLVVSELGWRNARA